MDNNVVDITEKIEIMDDFVSDPENDNTDKADEIEEVSEPIDFPESAIEAILFSMGDSVEIKKISAVIGRDIEETEAILNAMKESFDNDPLRGVTLTFLEGNVQMCSKSDMFEHIVKIAKAPKNYSLTDVVLETLSIIAYKQPVTKLEIEKIRGVSCDFTVNKLLELNLIQELGRLDAPGRPLLFGTTEQFLRSFGVTSLDELPNVSPERLEEFKEEAAKEVQLELNV